jgi:hypothetical protein
MKDRDTALFAIYVNDHLAALVTGRELARRTSAGASDTETRSLARELVSHFVESERELERLCREIGARPSRFKRTLAAAAEKGGRLKLNGHVMSRSPLSDLVELEGLTVLLEYELALWRSLDDARPELARPEDDFVSRERHVCEWRDRLVAHAREVAASSLVSRPSGARR